MPFIEIITDAKSQSQLSKAITKQTVKNAEVLYVKEKNIQNIKNIKLETIVVNRKIENTELMNKMLKNAKNVIINLDFNEELSKVNERTITFGYSNKADITISSVRDDEAMLFIQNTINSIYGKKIEEQEVKVNIKNGVSMYDIMIVIALNSLYAGKNKQKS